MSALQNIFLNDECKACHGMGFRTYMGESEECSVCDGIGRQLMADADELIDLIERIARRQKQREKR